MCPEGRVANERAEGAKEVAVPVADTEVLDDPVES